MGVGAAAVAEIDLLVPVVGVFEFGTQGEIVIVVLYVEPGVVLVPLLLAVL